MMKNERTKGRNAAHDAIEPHEGEHVFDGGNGRDLFRDDIGRDDLVIGGNGKDRLDGGAGDDRIFGGNGRDILIGGAGLDELHGGNGADIIQIGGPASPAPSTVGERAEAGETPAQAAHELVSGGRGGDRFVLFAPAAGDDERTDEPPPAEDPAAVASPASFSEDEPAGQSGAESEYPADPGAEPVAESGWGVVVITDFALADGDRLVTFIPREPSIVLPDDPSAAAQTTSSSEGGAGSEGDASEPSFAVPAGFALTSEGDDLRIEISGQGVVVLRDFFVEHANFSGSDPAALFEAIFETGLGDPSVEGPASIDDFIQFAGWDKADPADVVGSAEDDEIAGGDDDELLRGEEGDDVVDGGTGTDTALFDGLLSEYSVARSGQELIVADGVAGRDGTDTLRAVERVAFADGVLAFDFDGSAGRAYRLYEAVLDRAPDRGGLSHWVSRLDDGSVDPFAAASHFMASDEFASRFGSPDELGDAALIDVLYRNILDRGPEAEGREFWLDVLARGTAREEVLLAFSESDENKQALVGVAESGIVLDTTVVA